MEKSETLKVGEILHFFRKDYVQVPALKNTENDPVTINMNDQARKRGTSIYCTVRHDYRKPD
jgi:hypothetical protein